MWFIAALLTTAAWGCADLFYKKGSDPDDRHSHQKIVIAVGLVMGLHATAYMLLTGIRFDPADLLLYLPVSALYILSMAIGYVGLRYIELSIASPVQNSSGAMTTILLVLVFHHVLSGPEIFGVTLVTTGVIVLAVLEKRAERKARLADAGATDPKYRLGFLAIVFPILYAVIDGLGTFADAVYLDELSLIGEDAALIAYEYTFLLVAAAAWVHLRLKRVPFNLFREKEKGAAALFETAGQFFYVIAMARNAVISAPIIASYSIVSVLLSRLFLKEKLSRAHYAVIAAVMLGIAVLGAADAE